MTVLEPAPAAIRMHGRAWVRRTPGLERYGTGWRHLTWTQDLGEAEKFTNEARATAFAERFLNPGYEIVVLGPRRPMLQLTEADDPA